jgi:hypothetical protein
VGGAILGTGGGRVGYPRSMEGKKMEGQYRRGGVLRVLGIGGGGNEEPVRENIVMGGGGEGKERASA